MRIKAKAHPQPRDTHSPKAGFETCRKSEANNVRFTKKAQIFHVFSNVEKDNAIDKGIIFFEVTFTSDAAITKFSFSLIL